MDSTIEKIMTTKSRYSKEQKRDFPFVYALVAIPVLHFIVFWVYVNFSSIILAFQDDEGAFTLYNFVKVYNAFVYTDEFGYNILSSLKRSLIIWSCGTIITFPISIITTYVLACKIRFHYVYRVIYVLPGLIGSVIWAQIVREFFAYNGPVIAILKAIKAPISQRAMDEGLLTATDTAFPSLLIMNIILGLIDNNAIVTGAFSAVSDEVMESADLDGAGFWTKCFKIAIPCIWPTITTLLIFKLAGIFTADVGVFLYTNGTGMYETSTVGFMLFKMTQELSMMGAEQQSFGYPAAFGLFLTVITLPLCLVGRYYLEKFCDKLMGV